MKPGLDNEACSLSGDVVVIPETNHGQSCRLGALLMAFKGRGVSGALCRLRREYYDMFLLPPPATRREAWIQPHTTSLEASQMAFNVESIAASKGLCCFWGRVLLLCVALMRARSGNDVQRRHVLVRISP